MAHAECRKPPKLCRRTFFLRNGSAPTRSEMREELGGELADVILATLQPSQRAALPVDRLVLTKGHKSLVTGGRDSEEVRGQIHDHIMKIGGNVSQRLEGYWRQRMKETAASVVAADDLDFVRFECKQKIAIARDEERKRYEWLWREKEEVMLCRFRQEKDDLQRSYGEARDLWGRFVCRKVRTQAKQLLCQIAARYRVKLEQELNQRLQQERARMMTEMEEIVRRALEYQKRMHEQTIELVAYQHEKQLQFKEEELPPEDKDSSSLILYGTQSSSMSASELRDHALFVISQCLAMLDDDLKSQSKEKDKEVNQPEQTVADPFEMDRQPYPRDIFDDLEMNWKKKDPIESSPFARAADTSPEANIDRRSIGMFRGPTRGQISQEPLATVSSYRDSYDTVTEPNDVLSLVTSDRAIERVPDERFDELFDLQKSEDQIAQLADSIVPAYIQATDDDYAEMFPKLEDM
ncbi:uncharacterized protein LOC118459017 [Anopheles albimanus]|uniref:uncharacterized protein LOC118459017 n=1 Tax=Anopheles albimanus TaxID=7167 RepID=UPI00163EED8A|nr:uncharacterized protein LOC118459017 [Anopheles albimanus]